MPSRIIQVPWEPGFTGKGIYWPEIEKLETWSDPRHHIDVYNAGDYGQAHCLGIDSNGNCWHEGELNDEDWENPNGLPVDQLARVVHRLDPRLTPRRMNTNYNWDFNASAKRSHVLGWQPGEYGKGLVHNNEVHTWGTGNIEGGEPTHPDYVERQFPDEEYFDSPIWNTAFNIDAVGNTRVYEPEHSEKIGPLIESADPRLKVNYNHDYDWDMGPTEGLPTKPDSEDEARMHNVEFSNNEPEVATTLA
jgi:hypothetical protein